MQCNANMLPATVALDLVLIFALLTYTKKEKVQKNNTSTDLNPTINTNPNPQSTKLQNEKELNKARFMTLCKTAPYRNSLTYLYTGWSKKADTRETVWVPLFWATVYIRTCDWFVDTGFRCAGVRRLFV